MFFHHCNYPCYVTSTIEKTSLKESNTSFPRIWLLALPNSGFSPAKKMSNICPFFLIFYNLVASWNFDSDPIPTKDFWLFCNILSLRMTLLHIVNLDLQLIYLSHCTSFWTGVGCGIPNFFGGGKGKRSFGY